MLFKSDKLDYWQQHEQKSACRSGAKEESKVVISDTKMMADTHWSELLHTNEALRWNQ